MDMDERAKGTAREADDAVQAELAALYCEPAFPEADKMLRLTVAGTGEVDEQAVCDVRNYLRAFCRGEAGLIGRNKLVGSMRQVYAESVAERRAVWEAEGEDIPSPARARGGRR